MPLSDLLQVQFLQAPGDHIIFLRNSVTTSRSIACKEYFLPPANEVWGKVISLHLSVILFTGGVLPHCMLGYTPPPGTRGRHPPGEDTPQGHTTPPGQRHSAPPPGTVYAGRYGQQAGGTHPTGMQSCLLMKLPVVSGT